MHPEPRVGQHLKRMLARFVVIVLARPTEGFEINYESGGQMFESFRARHLTN